MLGKLPQGETGTVNYEPGDDTSDNDIAGKVEGGTPRQWL